MEQQVIANRFEIGKPIGRGGMGDVFLGHDRLTGQSVAVKSLREDVVWEPRMVERFAREGEVLRQLQHPNIVQVIASVTEEGRHHIVMEYVSGGSLAELLARERRLPLAQVREIGLGLADALIRAHSKKIVHRDIKPSNVLLADDGTPRLTDFGIAHIGDLAGLTQTGAILGTHAYLSPEACAGQETDKRADIWAFGILLYEMTAGVRPFVAGQLRALYDAIQQQPAPDLLLLRPDAPQALVNLIERMLAKKLDERIDSVRVVAAELERLTFAPSEEAPAEPRRATAPPHEQEPRPEPAEGPTRIRETPRGAAFATERVQVSHSHEFDLIVDADDDGFTVRVRGRNRRGTIELQPHRFELPFDLAELPRQRKDVVEWVKLARIRLRRGNEEVQAAREFGGRLFEHLFADEVLTAFRTCRMDLGSGEHLRIRLRMPDQLATLPWELLYDKERRQFLVLDNDLSLVRYPHVSRQVKPLRVDGPLQILAVLASPDDPINYRPIRVDHELRRVEDALRTAIQRRHVELGVIRGYNTLQKLRDRLRQPVPVHILHVLSHGELHEDSGECVLIFEDVDGAADPINAEVLKLAIEKNQGQTRLVLLNACLGALPVGNDPFSSIGAALAQGGVPAVIAMQFELADDAAADLAQIFYAELAGGMAIDVALREARQHLYTRNRSRLDWVVPVLYLHSEDGNLFEGVWVDHGARGWTTNILAEIEQAERQHQWVTAVELLERYCRHRPEDEYAGKRLAHARAEHELDLLAQKSRARIDAHDWEGALAALSEIWKIRPAYTHPAIDLAALREHAHAEQRMVRVTAEILTAEEQHNWKHAIILLEEYLQRRPEDDQARNRLSRAQMEAERERLLQIAHEQLVRLREGLESSDGQARVAAFDQLVSLVQKPDPYPEAVVLLAQQIEQPRLPFEQRLRAGQLVAVLGDTRPGVTTLPPAMAPLTSSVEFARYPTSVAQFRTFVQDGGYDPERAWWRPMSRQWLLAVQVAEPAFWQDERFGQRRLNHPVVGVSWFEAEAFCAWLTQSRQYNPEGLVYRLPTSAEWQQAAQGSERRDYAWGAEAPNAERANFAETQAGTTPLGCYIHGITPTSHVHDLAGNVWEWTSTIYQPSPSARATPLSIHEPAADHSFVVRGGCWRSPSPLLRTHHYYHYSPDYSSTNLGFRIVRIVKTTTSNDRL